MQGKVANRTKNLDTLFYPKSIAVVGATRTPGTVPHDILVNILKENFEGIVYPVSPREKSIGGVKAYKYIVDIEDPVDLAVLVFPSSVCHLAMEQLGQKGVKTAIVISAGFREVGPAGVERERQLKEIADKHGISFLGPNCLGLINTDDKLRLNASFARNMPEAGSIAFLSQSGALCTAVLDYAQPKHIGFSKFASFGNKADITEIDLLYYLKDDPKTKVILIYLEEITDGQALMRAAREIIAETGKPVLMIKSGRTREGAAAAASHTGSLAGSDEICDAALRQAGIIRCDTIEEMFNIAIALAYQPLPKSNRVAIITNAGGPGVLATDAAIREGLVLPPFSAATTEALKKGLPATANIKNPVDVIGDARADRYILALTSTLEDEAVDGALVILTPQSMTDIHTIATEVCEVSRQFEKPLYASFMGEADVSAGVEILETHNIPHYILPEGMCHSFAKAEAFRRLLETPPGDIRESEEVRTSEINSILEEARDSGLSYLGFAEAMKVIELCGLPLLEGRLALAKEDAAAIGKQIGFPVAMKVVSDDIIHKFDVQGVALDIQSEEEAGLAYENILSRVKNLKPGARIAGVYVQKMLKGGQEVILGLKRDSSFGPVLMFGLGGIFVEILGDVSFRVAPASSNSIDQMIREIRTFPLLAGARGMNLRDIAAARHCLENLSQMAVGCPLIKELDINPLFVMDEGKGCFVADARIMI